MTVTEEDLERILKPQRYIRSISDIEERSGVNLTKLVKKRNVRKMLDVPGISSYPLELAAVFPDLELHLLDKEPMCLDAIRYIVTGERANLGSLDEYFRANAERQRKKLKNKFMEENNLKIESLQDRIFYYNDDLTGGLQNFSDKEFDFSTFNYVFQYLPISKIVKTLMRIGEITNNTIFITNFAEKYEGTFSIEPIIECRNYKGIRQDIISEPENSSNLVYCGKDDRFAYFKIPADKMQKDILKRKVKYTITGEGHRTWQNVNLLAHK